MAVRRFAPAPNITNACQIQPRFPLLRGEPHSGQLAQRRIVGERQLGCLSERRLGEERAGVGAHRQAAGPEAVADRQVVHAGHRSQHRAAVGCERAEADADLVQRPVGESRSHREASVQHLRHAGGGQAIVEPGFELAGSADDDAGVVERLKAADAVLIECGGDMLAANIPVFLRRLKSRRPPAKVVLAAADPLGAWGATRTLRDMKLSVDA